MLMGSPAVVRFFVAVTNGRVVGSRSTVRYYLWAVLLRHRASWNDPAAWFATFHSDLAGARHLVAHHYPGYDKRIVEAIETTERLAVGSPFEKGPDEEEPHIPDVDETSMRQVEILEGVWRNS